MNEQIVPFNSDDPLRVEARKKWVDVGRRQALAEIKAIPEKYSNFYLGKVTKVYALPGLAEIVEYVAAECFKEDTGKTFFYAETDLSTIFDSFDQALMAVICHKYDSEATAAYVWRLLGVKDGVSEAE